MGNNDDIVFSLDMDGCIFHPDYETLRDLKLLEGPISAEKEIEILYETNEELFTDLIGIAKSTKRIHFILGTLRQDFDTDQSSCNLHNTMSCFHAINAIVAYFRQKLPEKEVLLHKYILADTYGQVEIGTSFDLALQELSGEKLTHHTSNGDESKFTIVYGQLNYFIRELSGRPFDYWLVDDKEVMLAPLHKFFKAHPDLIPKKAYTHMKAASYISNNVGMSCGRATSRGDHQYVTVDEREPEKVWAYNGLPLHLTAIEGVGPEDPAFEETIRQVPISFLFNKLDEKLYDDVVRLRQITTKEYFLPASAARRIFGFFESQDLAHASLVCQSWNSFIKKLHIQNCFEQKDVLTFGISKISPS